jgi:uncharacterized protein (DUF433 family)
MRNRLHAPHDIYGGSDPRDLPAYGLTEAARYLRVPKTTLRAWAFGQRTSGRGSFRNLIPARHRGLGMLSFNDLVSGHILSALRGHHVPMQRVRKAIDYLKSETGLAEPLIDVKFQTDGADIFVDHVGGTINASQSGQMALGPMLRAYLKRIEYDSGGVARLFPFIRRYDEAVLETIAAEPRFVVMDPRVAFGRPILAGTNIRTSVIADRYLAGESVAELAGDYHRPVAEIEDAIRCESVAA